MQLKDYENIVNFINDHNDAICHITTWQTYGLINKEAFLVMVELLDNELLGDMTNEQLWKTKNYILRNLTKFQEALNNGDMNEVFNLLEQMED